MSHEHPAWLCPTRPTIPSDAIACSFDADALPAPQRRRAPEPSRPGTRPAHGDRAEISGVDEVGGRPQAQ